MEDACEREITQRVMEKSIYFGSVLGTSLFLIWVAWMPLLQVCVCVCACAVVDGHGDGV